MAWNGWLVTNAHWWSESNQAYPWWDSFFETTLPRIIFWFVPCALMMTMRAVRRNVEEHASFFQTLAESMPFDIFVKDRARRFVYANPSMLSKLRRLPKNESLTLRTIQQKMDEELNLEAHKCEAYKEIDLQVLDGKPFHALEPNFATGATDQIETVKVPIKDRLGKPAYILGLCRHQKADDDCWFFLNLVAELTSHFFFRKEDGVFVWASNSFARDAGRPNGAAVVGLTDHHLYEEPHATNYVNDDRVVASVGALVREEWHQPKNKPRRRVRVFKTRAPTSRANGIGVRGYFRDIHKGYLLHLSGECLYSRYLPKLSGAMGDFGKKAQANPVAADPIPQNEQLAIAASSLGVRLLLRMARLLNVSEYELEKLSKGTLDDLPESLKSLRWEDRKLEDVSSALREICSVASLLHPKVTFEVEEPSKTAQRVAAIDREWMQVAVLGLCLNAAMRLEENKIKRKLVVVGAHYELDTEKGSSLFACTVTDHLDDPEMRMSAEEMSEYVPPGREEFVTGLQTAFRVLRLHHPFIKIIRASNFDRTNGGTSIFQVRQSTDTQ